VNGELLGVGFFLTDDSSFEPARRLSGAFTLSEAIMP
jgi:hypothetical protein